MTEVYAMEAVILDARKSTELKLQAIRIGDLTIGTLPNEVYAITGLKLKAQSPLKNHFNIEPAMWYILRGCAARVEVCTPLLHLPTRC